MSIFMGGGIFMSIYICEVVHFETFTIRYKVSFKTQK